MKHWIETENAPQKGLLSPSNLINIKFRHLKWMKQIIFSYPSSKTFQIKMVFDSLDRNNKKSINLTYEKKFQRRRIKNTQYLLSKIREMAKYTVCHEIDESLYFKNKRIFDPHL